jgi:hypothetical protein
MALFFLQMAAEMSSSFFETASALPVIIHCLFLGSIVVLICGFTWTEER